MVIETSALIAILQDEPERSRYIELISSAERVYISAASVLESYLVLARRIPAGAMSPEQVLREFIQKSGAEIVPVDEQITFLAIEAAARYRKGIHPAGLNFGDLLSYATAKKLNLPLLFKGTDFDMTDIVFLQW